MIPTVLDQNFAGSPTITQQLKASGVARVIVRLAPSVGASSTRGDIPAHLRRYFRSSELSQQSAIREARSGGRAAAGRRAAAGPSPEESEVRVFPNLGVLLGTVDAGGLAQLRADPMVSEVTGTPQFSLIWPTRAVAASLSAQYTWGLRMLQAPRLWRAGLTGKNVRVGHLDTGVDGQHPALKGAIAKFAEFDEYGRARTPTPKAWDSDDHGTHTAATIAGRPVRKRHIGIAPDAKLASAMVIEGGDVVARVLGGLDWAIEMKCRVVSLSLGFRGWWEDFIPIVDILRENNILPVVAVGNEGPGTSRSPGNYPPVVSVGAIDRARRVAYFSSSQRFARTADPVVPDIVAPGVDVISARPGKRYQSMDGTSMATPHVAGLAALLVQAKPSATVNELEAAIFGSCVVPPGGILDRVNRGLPDGVRAIEILTGTRIR